MNVTLIDGPELTSHFENLNFMFLVGKINPEKSTPKLCRKPEPQISSPQVAYERHRQTGKQTSEFHTSVAIVNLVPWRGLCFLDFLEKKGGKHFC